MAKVCQLTGKRTQVGWKVSHANNHTKRKFYPNLQRQRFFSEELQAWVELKVSTKAIRNINKMGLDGALKKAIQKGTLSV